MGRISSMSSSFISRIVIFHFLSSDAFCIFFPAFTPFTKHSFASPAHFPYNKYKTASAIRQDQNDKYKSKRQGDSEMKYLSMDEVISAGTEFTGDVCYSGEYGQQVYTKDIEDGGRPIEGILYERYPNGLLNYYSFYSDGVPNGQSVSFFESGKVKSHCIMDTGTIDGEYIEWYENGNIKLKKDCKYGLVLKMQEFDEAGNLVKEKKKLNDGEKRIFEKRTAYYEKRTRHAGC